MIKQADTRWSQIVTTFFVSSYIALMKKLLAVIPSENMESLILLARSQRVMIDSDLAKIYGVITKQLNQA